MKDTNIGKATVKAVAALLDTDAHVATVYLSDTLTVRATRVLFKGKIPKGRLTRYDITLTIGRPNFQARAFIKKAKRAGEPFPIKKAQLKFAA